MAKSSASPSPAMRPCRSAFSAFYHRCAAASLVKRPCRRHRWRCRCVTTTTTAAAATVTAPATAQRSLSFGHLCYPGRDARFTLNEISEDILVASVGSMGQRAQPGCHPRVRWHCAGRAQRHPALKRQCRLLVVAQYAGQAAARVALLETLQVHRPPRLGEHGRSGGSRAVRAVRGAAW